MNIWGVRFSIEFEFNVFKAFIHWSNALSKSIVQGYWVVCLVWIWGVNKLKWICQIVMHQACLMPRFGFWKYGRKLFTHQRIQEKGFWLENQNPKNNKIVLRIHLLKCYKNLQHGFHKISFKFNKFIFEFAMQPM